MKKLSFFFFCLLLLSCCGRKEENSTNSHLPEGNIITHASLLSISEREGYDLVEIKTSPDGKDVTRYVLKKSSAADLSDTPADAIILTVPLSTSVIDSEVYASLLEELGSTDMIKGVFDGGYITSPSLREMIDKGHILDVGTPSEPNREKILSLNPQAITLSYFKGMDAKNIDNLGVPVIKMSDLDEPTPLGRAEWIRLFGRLTGKAQLADSIFNSVRDNYESLKAEASKAARHPKVMTETIYQGVWYVPGGKSYQAQLIADAGGQYFMAHDTGSVTLNLSLEQVLENAHDADIWLIKVFGEKLSLSSLVTKDSRYAEFKPYKTGNIYFSDTGDTPLYREFPFHPDLLLREYMNIFSSDGKEPSNLRYFNKIGK